MTFEPSQAFLGRVDKGFQCRASWSEEGCACVRRRKIEQPVVSAGGITNVHALQHLLDDPKIPGIADEIGTELPLSRAAKGHVVPQDVILMATGIDDGRE